MHHHHQQKKKKKKEPHMRTVRKECVSMPANARSLANTRPAYSLKMKDGKGCGGVSNGALAGAPGLVDPATCVHTQSSNTIIRDTADTADPITSSDP